MDAKNEEHGISWCWLIKVGCSCPQTARSIRLLYCTYFSKERRNMDTF